MPSRPIVLDNPKGRRLRVAIFHYAPERRAYKPSLGQAVIFTVENQTEQRAMFRSLRKWGERRDWEKG